MTREVPLRERVRRWVAEYGTCTIAQVTAALGRVVSVAAAVAAGHAELAKQARRPGRKGLNPLNPIYTPARLAAMGRYVLAKENLLRLARDGRVVRLTRGVYAPPPPKLYEPPAISA